MSDGLRKAKSPIAEVVTIEGRALKHLVYTAIDYAQQTFGIDQMTVFALLGQAMGDFAAINDVITEKRAGIKDETDEAFAPLKQVFLFNFDVSYNEMRAEKEGKMSKPEPKIV